MDKIKIAILVKGGVVQAVIAANPGQIDVDVLDFDHDNLEIIEQREARLDSYRKEGFKDALI